MAPAGLLLVAILRERPAPPAQLRIARSWQPSTDSRSSVIGPCRGVVFVAKCPWTRAEDVVTPATDPRVESVRPSRCSAPGHNDPYYELQTNAKRLNLTSCIDSQPAGTKVAQIDTGVELNHPDLTVSCSTQNFVDGHGMCPSLTEPR